MAFAGMTEEHVLTFLISAVLILVTVVPYAIRIRRRDKEAARRYEQLKVSGLQAAVTMHPHIDALLCIGCGGCVSACPEGDVLGVIDGKATLVHGAKCVGHGLCADACPVGGITMLMASPGKSADLPILSDQFETTVKNLFIAGELGGIGLIRNAVSQGKSVIETIAARVRNGGVRTPEGVFDVAVVGAGPAGLAAALAAKDEGLNYVVLEQGGAGGTMLQYPRQKIVMTSPVELPIWGKLRLSETTKETLLHAWTEIVAKTELKIHTEEKVLSVRRDNELFHLQTSKGEYVSRHIVLALGRRGTPRKLGVPGEEKSKVTYRLMDAESYRGNTILVVGGGDSAVEAAMGLALQKTNTVTISYRKSEFSKIKARNMERLQECLKRGTITAIMESEVEEILDREVRLKTPQKVITLANEYVFIFAGGELPFEFLKSLGIGFQQQLIH
ncbi:MAG: NAD(P)-binding domain-containing protein [Bacteroidota bacterium]